jgi:hypothetical protein
MADEYSRICLQINRSPLERGQTTKIERSDDFGSQGCVGDVALLTKFFYGLNHFQTTKPSSPIEGRSCERTAIHVRV